MEWPVQQCQLQKAWKLWASALQHLHRGSFLIKPLMNWISSPHQSWFWFMDSSRTILFYKPPSSEWHSAIPVSCGSSRVTRASSRHRFLSSSLKSIDLPDRSTLISTSINEKQSEDEKILSPGGSTFPPQPTPITSMSSSLIRYLWSHQFYKRLMGHINLSAPRHSSQITR